MQTGIVFAPISGEIVHLNAVPDPTFSQKMMGDGIAINPNEGKVVAPFDGEVILTFPTKHAIGLKNSLGMEILIHIGLETVSLDGQGFELHVKQGEKVTQGDVLITFDLHRIKEKAASAITPVVLTNGNNFGTIQSTIETKVTAGETVLLSITQDNDVENQIQPKQVEKIGYKADAKAIIAAIGGSDNILAAAHCVTRLRFALQDEEKVDRVALERLSVVKGSFSANGQFQVVIGQGTVDKVYAAMIEETEVGAGTKSDVKAASIKQQNALQRAIKVLADIFIPILPAIVTAGLLMGINNILVNKGIFYKGKSFIDVHQNWADLADMINIIANTAFTFLPALIGWSAVKRFGGNPLLGVVLGLILVHPDLLNAWAYGDALKEGSIPTWDLFGLEINKIGYQGQVLPVLFASWVLAKMEIILKKRVILYNY